MNTNEKTVAALKKAQSEVERLCSAGERWRMSIPANEQRDSDLIISTAITMALAALESQPVAGHDMVAYDGSTGHDSRCRAIPHVIRGVMQTGPCNCSLRTTQQPQAPAVEVPFQEVYETFGRSVESQGNHILRTFSKKQWDAVNKALGDVYALLTSNGGQ